VTLAQQERLLAKLAAIRDECEAGAAVSSRTRLQFRSIQAKVQEVVGAVAAIPTELRNTGSAKCE